MAGDFNRSPNSFNFDFEREAKNSLFKLMERYLVPVNPSAERTKSAKRHQWKRSLVELNGKFDPNYRHRLSSLIIQSYSEIGAFPHKYHVNGEPCQTHADWFNNVGFNHNPRSIRRQGISSLEYDTKGVYLASATKSGCLTVHDLDIQSADLKEDEAKQLLHISMYQQLDVVR
ncbi:UNVERIFIED_CONTAM: hypothetical protein Scaly_2863400 [Sesamum calycinum]|uniref:Uncharacterized protein n=1 Tax=Sesamum calycinum TaxID=2727403 RepID=A0AAW2LJ09_9LAMI